MNEHRIQYKKTDKIIQRQGKENEFKYKNGGNTGL